MVTETSLPPDEQPRNRRKRKQPSKSSKTGKRQKSPGTRGGAAGKSRKTNRSHTDPAATPPSPPNVDPSVAGDINIFEHFLSSSKKGPIGACGSHSKTAIKEKDVVRVGGFVFDIDLSHFTPDFAACVQKYLIAVLPEVELRQTSHAGNLHAVVRFRTPIAPSTARKIWGLLRKVLLSDPAAGFLMKARVPGSRKVKKDGDTCVVTLVRPGTPVAVKPLLSELTDVPVDNNGDLAGAAGWKRRQFRGVMTCLTAPNGQRIWDGQSSHGVCPVHGSGANPQQCTMDPDYANCSCFGDCAGTAGKPKTVTLADIVATRVIASGAWNEYRRYYEHGPTAVDGRRVVEHNSRRPLIKFYAEIIAQFQATGRHFVYGNTLTEINDGQIRPIANPGAFVGAVVSLMEVAVRGDKGRVYKRLAQEDAAAILNANALNNRLPAIDLFTEVPVFDADLNLVKPGYNAASRIFYAGEELKPCDELVCLPSFLQVVNFRETASRDNFVGGLLTCLLPTHFCGAKPAFIFDANRPGVGKTMLGRCTAVVSTAQPVTTATYNANDEEFEKMLASKVLGANYILVDNARGRRTVEVSSPVLERSITDQTLSYRQLGFNRLIERPNSVLWMLSMNNARLSPDLTDRGLPIRLHYEGEPTLRQSPIGDPEDYFREHRREIVGELLGMITRWIRAGCPNADWPFRFRRWASWVGGILAVNGFNDFLGNLQQSRVEFDPVLSALQVLAERHPDEFKKAAAWLPLLIPEGLLPKVWTNVPSERARASELGKLFTMYVSQEFQIVLDDGRPATARLTKTCAHAGTEWGFTTGDDGTGVPTLSPTPGGEGGEPPSERSPVRSSSEVADQQGVTGHGERGERRIRSSESSYTGEQENTVVRAEGLGIHPQTGSPRSPGPTSTPVSHGKNKGLASVNASVNAEAVPRHVHREDAQVGASKVERHDRSAVLHRLRGLHPAPPSALGGDRSTSPRATSTGSATLGDEQIVYEISWDGRPFSPGILAFDTETTAIRDDASVPDLVLATASDGERHVILAADEVADFLVVHRLYTLVFHNVAFDFWVLEQYFTIARREEARQSLWDMARKNRLRDTMLLDMLLRLGRDGNRPVPRDLGTVASEYAGLSLDKDDPFRKRFAEIKDRPLAKVNSRFLTYAAKDAVATIHTYAALHRDAEVLAQQHAGLCDPRLAARYGLLTEAIQVQGAIALAAVSRNGMHIDAKRVQRLRSQLERRRDDALAKAEEALKDDSELAGSGIVAAGVFKRTKDGRPDVTTSGSVRVRGNNLRTVLENIASTIAARRGAPLDIPRTPRSDAISTKAEHWAPYRREHPFVDHWITLNGAQKLLQFANAYADCRVVHPRYNVLMRTGRTSCERPALQQLPREGGIRECFIPSPGHLLVSVDYKTLELRTLAAVCESRFGFSKLGDVIRAGSDPHAYTASLIRRVSLDEFMSLERTDPDDFAVDRQRAKAVNFGVPGGLGARTLVDYAAANYGVTLSAAEAEALRDALVNQIYPELNLHLEDSLMAELARNLGVAEEACWTELSPDGERHDWLPLYIRNVVRGHTRRSGDGEPYREDLLEQTWAALQRLNTRREFASALASQQGTEELSERLFGGRAVATLTGRIRANVTYTQSRNTPFQGLAGDGAKLALFELIAAGYRVVAFVHDEVLVELPTDSDHTVETELIDKVMCAEMAEVTGNVPIACGKPALMERWSKDAKAVYDGCGRLAVWKPYAGEDEER